MVAQNNHENLTSPNHSLVAGIGEVVVAIAADVAAESTHNVFGQLGLVVASAGLAIDGLRRLLSTPSH